MKGADLGAVTRAAMTEQTLLIGPGASGASLAEELANRGWRRLYLLASASADASGALDSLKARGLVGAEIVGEQVGVRGHAPVADTERIADSLQGIEIDAIVTLGGGSVSDTAKGLAALLAEGGRLLDHCYTFSPPDDYRPRQLDRPKIPLVAVPTTLSGAELTGGAGVTTPEGVKRALWDDKLAARLGVYDPELFADVPPQLLVSTGMNAMAHCVEAVYSVTANPLSTALAMEGIRLLGAGLQGVSSSRTMTDLDDLSSGTALAGLAILNARVGIGHGVCHVLGGRYDVPHGVANSIMLPAAMRYNLPVTRPQQEKIVRALAGLGADAPVADPPEAIERFRQEIGAPARLRDIETLRHDDLDDIAEGCMQMRGTYFNPRPIHSAGDVREMLESAW